MFDGEILSLELLRRSAEQAGNHAGHAAAMIANLGFVRKSTDVWEAEQTVWEQRRKDAIDQAPLGKQDIAQAFTESFDHSFYGLYVTPDQVF